MEVLTDRLRLVPVAPEHASDLWSLHWDEGVAAWYAGRFTVATAIATAERMAHGWAVDGVHKWMAYSRESGGLVGRGGLSRAYVDGAWRLEIGWVVRSALWGRGYATEIGRAGLDHAFGALGADEVVAFTEPHNRRSRAVMERLGLLYARDITYEGDPFVLYSGRAQPSAQVVPAR